MIFSAKIRGKRGALGAWRDAPCFLSGVFAVQGADGKEGAAMAPSFSLFTY
jgi:hypothetical protein